VFEVCILVFWFVTTCSLANILTAFRGNEPFLQGWSSCQLVFRRFGNCFSYHTASRPSSRNLNFLCRLQASNLIKIRRVVSDTNRHYNVPCVFLLCVLRMRNVAVGRTDQGKQTNSLVTFVENVRKKCGGGDSCYVGLLTGCTSCSACLECLLMAWIWYQFKTIDANMNVSTVTDFTSRRVVRSSRLLLVRDAV